ncbi:MAG: cytochrome c oxidase accessory protein CcoG, partial [Devosia sp.]
MTTDSPTTESYDVEAVNAAKRRQPLYAPRKKIFPKRTQGRFRSFKWLVMAITLTIYYVTPWLRWDRGPYAPDQAVLIDLADRRFYFFFIEIWPQEFYYVAGLLVMAGFGLFLVTSTVGRAWCGYACPQTVWVDLFLVVERGIEGDRNARMKLEAAPWTPDKLFKRISKHSIWLLIGVATGGAWIYYFADAPTLLRDVVTLQAPFVAYATIGLLTATTYTFGGLMREQVCTYMCPWPRIQGAMLDEHSLTVTYNDWRGEPRTRHAKKAIAEGKPVGDCVDCNACVVVCPMGIDIRDGQQLECITCALCIDACDDVMTKLGKEGGLISYATLGDYNRNMALATGGSAKVSPERVRDRLTGRLVDAITHTNWRSIVRPRTIIYLIGWSAI